jgi:hypothetical protein
MRGLLRITKAAPPLRRGGLVFAAIGVPLAVSAKQLTGERLAQLIADPTVAIEAGQDDGTFVPAPEFIDVGVDQLQMLIDAAPEVDLPAEMAADPVADALDSIYAKLNDAGFTTIDQALQAHADLTAMRSENIATLQAAGFESTYELIGALSETSKARGTEADRADVAEKRAAELEKEVAQLKAAAAKPAAKPAPADDKPKK